MIDPAAPVKYFANQRIAKEAKMDSFNVQNVAIMTKTNRKTKSIIFIQNLRRTRQVEVNHHKKNYFSLITLHIHWCNFP